MAKKKKSKRGLLGRYYAEGVGDSRADKVGPAQSIDSSVEVCNIGAD